MCIDFEYPLYKPSNYLRKYVRILIKILFGKIIKMINTYDANNNKDFYYRMCFGEKFSTSKQDTLT